MIKYIANPDSESNSGKRMSFVPSLERDGSSACFPYKYSVSYDLKHLDKSIAKRLIKDLETALSSNPHCGESLSGQFKGMFKLRIGDYRVFYSKTKEGVLILRIRHRSAVYEK